MNKSKPNKSGVIRKGSMPLEEITKLAQELQPEVVKVVEEPEIEPVKGLTNLIAEHIGEKIADYIIQGKEEPLEKGDYKAFAMSIKAKLTDQETVELTGDFIKSLFPQVRRAGEVVKNLKRTYGLSYRRVENGDNDIYVFFVEPTREELIVQLTSAESKVIELRSAKKELYRECNDLIDLYVEKEKNLKEENTKLKSELYNEKSMTIVSFVFAIICLIITISSGTISNLLTQIFGKLTQLQ